MNGESTISQYYNIPIQQSVLPGGSPPKCPTCGLLHPDCKDEPPRHGSPGSHSCSSVMPIVGAPTLEECLSSSPLLDKKGNILEESRIANCSKAVRTVACSKCNKVHKVPIRCKSRFCVICSRIYSRRLRKCLDAVIKERDLKRRGMRFVTLTSDNFPAEKALEGFELMERAFMTFRKRKITKKAVDRAVEIVESNPKLEAKWKAHYKKRNWKKEFYKYEGRYMSEFFKGGLKREEITKSDTGEWHDHIHIPFEGGFISQPIITAVWSDVHKNQGWKAEVTDIRKVAITPKSLREFCKYPFKPSSLALEDCVYLDGVLKNRRMFSFFGEWFNLLKGYMSYLDDEEPFVCRGCGNDSFYLVSWDIEFIDDLDDTWVERDGVYIQDTS